MDRFVFLTVDGLSRGAVFAAFALALVLIWRAARVVNFAQGAMAVAAAYVAYTVTTATGSYWLGFVVALVAGLLLGALVDRVVMRHVDHASPLNPVIVALGLVLLIQAVLGMVYGNEFRPAEAPFSRTALTVGGVAVLSPYDLFVFARRRGGQRPGLDVHADPGGAADAGGGLRPRGLPAARGQRRRDAHPRLGARRGGGRAGRDAGHPDRAGPAPARDGPGVRLGVHRGGGRRAGQPDRARWSAASWWVCCCPTSAVTPAATSRRSRSWCCCWRCC